MLILTNCLTDITDEGCLRLANSLIKRIKAKDDKTVVLSYDRQNALSDEHFNLNKLLLNRKFIKKIRFYKAPILYVPFPAKTLATALRVFILSLFSKKNIRVVMVQRYHYNSLARFLLKLSKAKLVVMSQEAMDFYGGFVNKERITYLKTGVDTEKFVPVSCEQKNNLRKKYGFDTDKKLVLHCGHLNYGRGVDNLLKISKEHQVLLVVSTLTKNEQDSILKKELLQRDNIRIIEDYVENIQEIYQMSDVYFFPVKELGRCIDVPLSCLEAASCNIPVVTTDFGEMKALIDKDGFYQISDTDSETINNTIKKACDEHKTPRSSVIPYDWDKAVRYLSDTQ